LHDCVAAEERNENSQLPTCGPLKSHMLFTPSVYCSVVAAHSPSGSVRTSDIFPKK
uniref:Ovule protein n=1 Tax=Haemonchus placei TaxID=6290 RepID=A0A0N4WK48_HAEPC